MFPGETPIDILITSTSNARAFSGWSRVN